MSGIYNFPAAKINGVKYLGNIDSDDILEMVCASLAVGYANLPNGLPIRKVNEPKGYKVTFID